MHKEPVFLHIHNTSFFFVIRLQKDVGYPISALWDQVHFHIAIFVLLPDCC